MVSAKAVILGKERQEVTTNDELPRRFDIHVADVMLVQPLHDRRFGTEQQRAGRMHETEASDCTVIPGSESFEVTSRS